MNTTKQVDRIITNTFGLGVSRRYEYATPELLLLVMSEEKEFIMAFNECGGSISVLSQKLEGYLDDNIEIIPNPEDAMSVTEGLALTLAVAQNSAINSGKDKVNITHLVHGLFSLKESYAVYYMLEQGVTEVALLQSLSEYSNDYEEDNVCGDIDIGFEPADIFLDEDELEERRKGLENYTICLNDNLSNVNPLIGREEELERTIQILCRKDKNNPLHIGEAGVGKTAITYGLARLINEGNVPESLKGARIYMLDLGSVVAGTQYRGDFEKRLKHIMDMISKEDNPIVYIDEIHNLMGAGAVGEGSFDAANLLKPYLLQGKIRFIGATTFDEYKKYFEKSKSMVRRFENVEIKEPSKEDAVKILYGLKNNYEKFHGVSFAKGVLEYAVDLSDKFINERYLPDKAIDLIDEAGAYRKIHPLNQKKQTVNKDLIDEILVKICRIPKNAMAVDDVRSLSTLEKRIKDKVFGQDKAVSLVVNAVKFSKAGLNDEDKPIASLLFVGPTGVGKTEIAKMLSLELGIKLVRFDMSEYGEKNSVAKLIGAPAGYVGYEDGGLLTEQIRKNPSCVLLLDEIEKAHPDIFSTLLQVMDYATLTDNQGRKADFRNVIIIMTSNAGATRMGKSGMGFLSSDLSEDTLLDEVNHIFTPEFRNRLNGIVPFKKMDDEMAHRIAKKKISELVKHLSDKKVELEATQKSIELIRKKGVSEEYGARQIDRVIQNEIKPLLVDELLFGKLKKGGKCVIDVKGDTFCLEVI